MEAIKGLRKGSEVVSTTPTLKGNRFIIVKTANDKYVGYFLRSDNKAVALYFRNKQGTNVNTRSFNTLPDATSAVNEYIKLHNY